MTISPALYTQLVQYGSSWSGQCPLFGYRDSGPMGYWLGGPIMMLLLFVLLFVAVYAIARYTGRDRTPVVHPDTPLDIARKRYARGEITKEQYETLKSDLKD
ncbi:MAG TPA: SHOCT domain-containing protein [Deltaproteobacteria bacterium]|nr:SHOCT domain-containing protein [Deltaproteobacteria bacterium]HPR55938.1 SHOCT domain-containing protein [Deltaproteobacteria bacterium]HXK48802.1 SHOCT domain-containing protein [Deltaproteobacteria bacterium]